MKPLRNSSIPALVFALVLALSFTARAVWQQTQTFTAADGAAFDQFGFHVAINGGQALAGANQRDVGINANQGAAFLFDPLTGVQIRTLTASDGSAGDGFGSAVALSGTTALVGAPYDDVAPIGAPAVEDVGSAYLYNTETGAEIAHLSESDGNGVGDYFGLSVALDGDVALVGAPDSYLDGIALIGLVRVFDASDGELEDTLSGSDSVAADHFGTSVALSGDYAVIGAPYADVGAIQQAGKAYIFNVATSTELFKLTADDAETEENFGSAVAIGGNYAAVAAVFDQINSVTVGSVYVFDRATGVQLRKLIAPDGTNVARFGSSLSISGNILFIGARGEAGSTGSVYIFDLTTGLLVQKLTLPGGAPGDAFGYGVGVDGKTAVIGAFQKPVGQNLGQGRVFVFSDVAPVVVPPVPDTIKPVLKGLSKRMKVLARTQKVQFSIKGTVTDNVKVKMVRCLFDGRSLTRNSSSKNWSFTVSIKQKSRAFSTTVRIRAYDTSNNMASKTLTLKVPASRQ